MADTAPATTAPPSGNARPGTLARVTAQDRGPVAQPALAPHLEFRAIGDGQTLLVSESFNTLLRGRVYSDLLPLLDGRRRREEIVEALAKGHPAAEIRKALTALADRGYVVSGEHSMERARAAYWTSLGASPRWAEQRLKASRVAVSSDDGSLARHLA